MPNILPHYFINKKPPNPTPLLSTFFYSGPSRAYAGSPTWPQPPKPGASAASLVLIAVRSSSMVRAMITTVSGATARPRPSQSKGSRNSLFVRKSSFSSVVAEQVDFSQRVFSERDQALIRFLATQERKIVARIENAWLQKTKARVLCAPKPPEPPKRSALLPHEQWMPIGRQGSPRSPLQPSTPSPLNDFAHTRARPRRPSGTYDITGFGAALSAALGHDGTVTQKVVHLLVSEGVTDQVPSIQTLVPLIACALSAHVACLPVNQSIWDNMDVTVRVMLLADMRGRAGLTYAELSRVEAALSQKSRVVTANPNASRMLNCLGVFSRCDPSARQPTAGSARAAPRAGGGAASPAITSPWDPNGRDSPEFAV